MSPQHQEKPGSWSSVSSRALGISSVAEACGPPTPPRHPPPRGSAPVGRINFFFLAHATNDPRLIDVSERIWGQAETLERKASAPRVPFPRRGAACQMDDGAHVQKEDNRRDDLTPSGVQTAATILIVREGRG